MTSSKQALIVDDDEALRISLAEQLELHEGFVTYQAEDGAQALDLVKQHHFEFILMDVGLPDIDGRDLCRLMRRQGIKTPIIGTIPTPTPSWAGRQRQRRLRSPSASACCSPGCAPSCASSSCPMTRPSRSAHLPAEREDADRVPRPTAGSI